MEEQFKITDVVSDEYRDFLVKATNEMPWGGEVAGSVPRIRQYALDHGCESILDYGSGKSDFLNTLNSSFPDHGFEVNQYEPGRPEFAADPKASDMTVCVDVLEHIEPEKLDAVLKHIYDKTGKIFYFKVCLVPSHSFFEDGRNLHLIVEPKEFWLDKLSEMYNLDFVTFTPAHVWGLAIKK